MTNKSKVLRIRHIINCAVNECGGNLTVFHFGESESAAESCVESCGSFTLVFGRGMKQNFKFWGEFNTF
jgi:hypothetical protein